MITRFLKRTLSLVLAICMVVSVLTVTAFAEAATWKPADSTKIYVDANAVGYFSYLQYEAIFFQGEPYRSGFPILQNVHLRCR